MKKLPKQIITILAIGLFFSPDGLAQAVDTAKTEPAPSKELKTKESSSKVKVLDTEKIELESLKDQDRTAQKETETEAESEDKSSQEAKTKPEDTKDESAEASSREESLDTSNEVEEVDNNKEDKAEAAKTTPRKSITKPKVEPTKTVKTKKKKKPKTFDDLVVEVEDWFVTRGLHVAIIASLTLIAMYFSNVISKNLFEFIVRDRVGTELKKRATTLSTISRYLMMIGILAVGGMMILNKLGVDIAPLLAGAGVLGIALGFGAQNLVKDLISGAFILLEDQIRVGDVIQIADKRGTVEKVTLRMVVLRDVSGNVHFIPSGDIQVVTNMTKTFSRYLFDVGIAYKENTDEVIELMKEVDEEMREDEEYKDLILAPLEIMGVQRFESSSVIIRARTKTLPGKQWKVGRQYNRRFKLSFDKNGVEIPFPHMTVYQGVNKNGESQPLNLHLESGSNMPDSFSQ